MKEFYPHVYHALQSQVKQAGELIRKKGIKGAQGNIHVGMVNDEIGRVVRGLYKAAAIQALKKYKINKKSFGYNPQFIEDVIQYFSKYILNKVVVPISRTTINFIEEVLQHALGEGWGVDKTVQELEDSDITKNRARMIVRTETVRATNFAQLAAADDEDYEVEKQWIAVEDNRTRPAHSHSGVDGERTNLYDPFSNGLMFPGDPMGEAAQTINCRCTMGYFLKRDLSGRPIPKKNKGLNLLSKINLGRVA